jgi:hypothetical protein
VNIARIYMTGGKTEKALKILLVLRDHPVEYKEAQDERDCLLANLQAVLPKEQLEEVMKQVNLRVSTKHTVAEALDYALELVTE